jgi:transcriptional regulator with XRE-family HTH domain
MTRKFEVDLKHNLQDPEFAQYFGAAQAKSSFAITLAEARMQLNLTQQQLASRLGVSQSYIAKLEGGEANPTLERIGSLLAVLGLSLTTNTTKLSPYNDTSSLEDTWPPVPSLITAFERVPVISDATEGIGSSSTKRELVKIT